MNQLDLRSPNAVEQLEKVMRNNERCITRVWEERGEDDLRSLLKKVDDTTFNFYVDLADNGLLRSTVKGHFMAKSDEEFGDAVKQANECRGQRPFVPTIDGELCINQLDCSDVVAWLDRLIRVWYLPDEFGEGPKVAVKYPDGTMNLMSGTHDESRAILQESIEESDEPVYLDETWGIQGIGNALDGVSK